MIDVSGKKIGRSINAIAAINGIAAVLHAVFWALAFRTLPSPIVAVENSPHSDLLTTYGIGVADLLFSMPLLFAGSVWLYRRKFIGFLAAQMANALWWYSFMLSFVRDIHTGLRPGTALFLPFALFSLWAARHLWQHRHEFSVQPD